MSETDAPPVLEEDTVNTGPASSTGAPSERANGESPGLSGNSRWSVLGLSGVGGASFLAVAFGFFDSKFDQAAQDRQTLRDEVRALKNDSRFRTTEIERRIDAEEAKRLADAEARRIAYAETVTWSEFEVWTLRFEKANRDLHAEGGGPVRLQVPSTREVRRGR